MLSRSNHVSIHSVRSVLTTCQANGLPREHMGLLTNSQLGSRNVISMSWHLYIGAVHAATIIYITPENWVCVCYFCFLLKCMEAGKHYDLLFIFKGKWQNNMQDTSLLLPCTCVLDSSLNKRKKQGMGKAWAIPIGS